MSLLGYLNNPRFLKTSKKKSFSLPTEGLPVKDLQEFMALLSFNNHQLKWQYK